MDGEISVIEIVFAGEIAFELEGAEIRLELLPSGLQFGG
jgi:hypothetical protein